MGEDAPGETRKSRRSASALDLGMTLVDTAEMYGEGGAEEVVGEAIRGRRETAFVVSKFYPHHASRQQLRRRLRCARSRASASTRSTSTCYHWRGNVPLAETVDALEELVSAGQHPPLGRIQLRRGRPRGAGRRFPAASASPRTRCSTTWRGAASSSTCCRGAARAAFRRMAYSPLDEGRLARASRARSHSRSSLGATAAQLALAWLAAPARHHRDSQGRASPSTCAQNRDARRSRARCRRRSPQLDAMFPPPRRKVRARDDLKSRIGRQREVEQFQLLARRSRDSALPRGDGSAVCAHAVVIPRNPRRCWLCGDCARAWHES